MEGIAGTNGFQRALALGQAREAGYARGEVIALEESVRILRQALADSQAALTEQTRNVIKWQAHAKGQEAMCAVLRERLKAKGGDDILSDSTQVFRRGQHAGLRKTKLRLVFEKAHDDWIREKGLDLIPDPAAARASD